MFKGEYSRITIFLSCSFLSTLYFPETLLMEPSSLGSLEITCYTGWQTVACRTNLVQVKSVSLLLLKGCKKQNNKTRICEKDHMWSGKA